MNVMTKKIVVLAGCVLGGGVAGVLAQDVMQQRLPFLKVMAEDDKVRVLRYAPAAGDKSAMHSHPEAVVVVLKGGRVRYTRPVPEAFVPRYTFPDVVGHIAACRHPIASHPQVLAPVPLAQASILA